jgi:hypothetical protein
MPSENKLYQLSKGAYVRLSSVPAFMIERVQSRIPIPDVPIFVDEDGREIPNPTDPDYIRARDEAEVRKIATSILAAVIFGAELVDENGNKIHAPGPEEENWEAKLAYVGIDWKEQFDDDIPLPPDVDLAFARDACYMLYIQMSPEDIQHVASATMGGGEAYATAVNTFPGNAPRNPNLPARAKRRKSA